MPETEVATTYTKAQKTAAEDALDIDSGACNVAGIANALHEASVAWLHTNGTDQANTCAPVKLIMHQLNFLVFRKEDCMSFTEYMKVQEECNKIAGRSR
jgi:hypothetical protein